MDYPGRHARGAGDMAQLVPRGKRAAGMILRTEHGPNNMAMNLIRGAAGKDSLKSRRKAAA